MQEKSYKLYTFKKANIYIFLVSIFLVVLGYILMAGGTSPDGGSFNPEGFSFTRITVAPILCTLGYAGILLAILWRGKKKEAVGDNTENKE
ncbi:DUF3098 domain-containing protein [Porphyromonas cangingivalis]|uniref:DUF3098 domain-containing protein n=1 Tax=Porphyromonas cangingivalis TaxID=36874 RepID=A0A1T4MV04_PORCN|nr:DUF3098 domain-containing protein [Porphyromonas cangingivalis]SJZ70478.1 Protein of unknown function [Porphyromonas cangingivalis]